MRFSLASLMVVTALIAVLCGIFFALPDAVSIFVLAMITVSVIPTVSITGIVFGRGKARAFSIGVLASMGWMGPVAISFLFLGGIMASGIDDEGSWVWKLIFACIYTTCLVCGGIAVGIRWLCQRGTMPPSSAAQVPSPSTVLIDPRDKAELFAILQGRIASGIDAPIGTALETRSSAAPLSSID